MLCIVTWYLWGREYSNIVEFSITFYLHKKFFSKKSCSTVTSHMNWSTIYRNLAYFKCQFGSKIHKPEIHAIQLISRPMQTHNPDRPTCLATEPISYVICVHGYWLKMQKIAMSLVQKIKILQVLSDVIFASWFKKKPSSMRMLTSLQKCLFWRNYFKRIAWHISDLKAFLVGSSTQMSREVSSGFAFLTA